MSGNVRVINQSRRAKNKQRRQYLILANETRKAKVIGNDPISTCIHCGMLPTAPKCVCMKCGSQNIYNTNQIDFTQHEPLVECQFGINAKRDITYEYVLNMSQEDLINTLSSHFIKEYIRNGETNITEEMLQRKFSEKTTKQLVRKLVKFIREKDDDTLPENVQQQLAEVKAQRISLGRKLQYHKSKDDNTDSLMEYQQLQKDASIGRSFIIQNTNLSAQEIDDYLFLKLDIPRRDVNFDKIDDATRHQLYILILYCEQSFPKLRMSNKTGYSMKSVKSATSSSEALELSLKNMFIFVMKHLPTIQDAAN